MQSQTKSKLDKPGDYGEALKAATLSGTKCFKQELHLLGRMVLLGIFHGSDTPLKDKQRPSL